MSLRHRLEVVSWRPNASECLAGKLKSVSQCLGRNWQHEGSLLLHNNTTKSASAPPIHARRFSENLRMVEDIVTHLLVCLGVILATESLQMSTRKVKHTSYLFRRSRRYTTTRSTRQQLNKIMPFRAVVAKPLNRHVTNCARFHCSGATGCHRLRVGGCSK